MIPIIELLYAIDLKLNKVATGVGQNIPLEDKIIILNEAQIKLMKKKVNPNNIYQVGFDGFRSRYQDLQGLVVPSISKKAVLAKDLVKEAYSVELEEDCFIPIEVTVKATKGECKGRTVNVPRIVKHSDVNLLLDNEHFKPSFEWQETLAVISDNKIIVYSGGDFKVDEVLVSYLRYPKNVDMEGYINFDGFPSQTVNSELPLNLKDELISMAVAELGYITGNLNIAESQISQSRNSE